MPKESRIRALVSLLLLATVSVSSLRFDYFEEENKRVLHYIAPRPAHQCRAMPDIALRAGPVVGWSRARATPTPHSTVPITRLYSGLYL